MSSEQEKQHEESGASVLEAEPVSQEKTQEPPLYRVFLLNDDYTPMDFVVDVLVRYFAMSEEKAIQVMMRVHEKGRGECGVFTRDVAETKVVAVREHARRHDHPLLCDLEKA